LTFTEVDTVEGEKGDFKVTLKTRPRYIIEEKCTGCTTCVEYCPVAYPDQFNQGISDNKAVHVFFSQAIPLVAYIDDSCLYLKEKKCDICRGVCQADAIDFRQTPKKSDINVGAIVLASGITPFDPSVKEEYKYEEYQNVVTSMDYERLLSSTGPYEGKVLRASDKKHPKKIAWIQCIGSRRVTEEDNSYCSGVCCTYTQKQVILTKDHEPDTTCTIFHNDIRSFGKDFERYFQRAEQLDGVDFIRSYASVAKENPETKNVSVRYATTDEGVKEEEFDMVVLSIGLNPPKAFKEISDKFNIEVNSHGFNKQDHTNPMLTSQPGIFVSGAFQGPTDIPESVFTASAAGTQIGEMLDYRRGNLAKERVYPEERDVSQEEPRIGVFVCHCGANISSVVNVPSTVDYALTLPNVVYAKEQIFSCATNSAQEITDLAKSEGLNRVVIAACSPRTLEPLFRDTLREAGLNQYYLDMANIREHCSWVHAKQKEDATKKAHDIVRMSVVRASYLEPLQEFDLPVNPAALVVGGGVAGMTCALSIASQGHEVELIEKNKDLGGMALRLQTTIEGMDVQAYLKDLIQKVYKHPLVHVSHEANIKKVEGYVGSFVTTIETEGRIKEIKHGASVLAIGAEEYKPAEYLYGEDDKVFTHIEVGEEIAKGNESITNAETLVMIQCVGSRNEERNYCSRVCCSHAIKNALKLKKINPDMRIYVLFRDMRTYGFKEDYYREASEAGVQFIRYVPEEKPVLEATKEGGKDIIRVTVPDYVLGQKLELDADIVSLASAVIPTESTNKTASHFKVTLSPDEFFKEAHVKLKPVEFAADGVFLCGTAHYPKHIQETINQAYGAAGRALTLLTHDTVVASGSVCEVNMGDCVSCGACITACTYGAIDFVETPKGNKAKVNPVLCKGDGLCNAKCPTNAIILKHFTDEGLFGQIEAAVTKEEIMEQMEAVFEEV
jgi:heterodisulfide reductase subunit A2